MPLPVCQLGVCRAAIDSGTSLVTGPTVHVRALLERLGVARDCSNMGALPAISFVAGALARVRVRVRVRVRIRVRVRARGLGYPSPNRNRYPKPNPNQVRSTSPYAQKITC